MVSGQFVHLGELSSRSGQADLETAHLTEPAFASGFVDPGSQVVADLEQAGALAGIGSKHRAVDTGVLVGTRRPKRAGTGADRDLASLEVSLHQWRAMVG